MYDEPMTPEREACPACGGSGGGPFGRAGSGWDVETYECIRCEGWGYIREGAELEDAPPMVARPGIAKAAPERAPDAATAGKKRNAG